MSLVITVVSYKGAELSPPLVAHFDASGGSVGRSTDNRLVLPDPERGISRVHAELLYGGGGHKLVNRSGNPLGLNGRKLSRGQSSGLLRTGDRIQIGAYMMRAEVRSGAEGGEAPLPNDPRLVCSWEVPAGEHRSTIRVPPAAS